MPTVVAIYEGSASVSGTVTRGASGSVQICVDGSSQGSPQPANADGTFTITVATLKAKQKVRAQFISSTGSSGATTAGLPNAEVLVGTKPDPDSTSKVVLIGGVEQSGYSSLTQSTNPFINIFLEGPGRVITGWGRVRLLATPQPSTQGIVSTFTDPTRISIVWNRVEPEPDLLQDVLEQHAQRRMCSRLEAHLQSPPKNHGPRHVKSVLLTEVADWRSLACENPGASALTQNSGGCTWFRFRSPRFGFPSFCRL